MRKVWFVKHPIGQYNEDVKSLARKADLIVYDEKFAGSFPADVVETDVPKLTIKGSKPKAKKAKKIDAPVVEEEIKPED